MINVQAIPVQIFNFLVNNARNNTRLLRWFVKEGDFVEKGQVIACYECNPVKVRKGLFASKKMIPNILSPARGKIEYISENQYSKWRHYKSWNECSNNMREESHLRNVDILFSINETNDEGPNVSLYSVYRPLVDYVYYKTEYSAHPNGNSALSPQFVVFYIEMLAHTRISIE